MTLAMQSMEAHFQPGPEIANRAAVHPGHGAQAAATGVSQGVAMSLYTALEAVEAEWRTFEKTAHCTPFQSYGWLDKWQKHIGAARAAAPVIVVGRSPAGATLFLLPLAIERHRRIRRLIWLANERCDYNGPLLAPQLPEIKLDWALMWLDIVQLVRAGSGSDFDLVDLQKMPEAVGGQANPFLALACARNPNDGHVATLGGDWNEFYTARRSASSRKVQRKHLNRLKEHGELKFVDSRDAVEIAGTLEAAFAQKSRTLARIGARDMLSRPEVRDFYRDVASDEKMADMIHVSRFDIGPEVGATSVGLVHDARYYLVLSSYNDGPLSRFGPGRAHLLELLRHAIARRMKAFDFTIGNEPYKLDWCDIRLPLFDHLSPVTWRGLLVMPVLSAANLGRRKIRNNPTAWRIFLAMRAWMHRMTRSERNAVVESSDPARGD